MAPNPALPLVSEPAEPADPADPARVRALPAGTQFTQTVTGTCMTPAGVFDGDQVILRRQDHAPNGQIVAAAYPQPPAGTPRLVLKHYHPDHAAGRVRLVAADRTQTIELAADLVQILGVLVGIQGTVELPADSNLGCPLHKRFLRPTQCGTCMALANPAIRPIATVRPRRHRATVVPAPEPGGALELFPLQARLLDRLAERLLDQVSHTPPRPP
jgi:hypothetical protein